jgi:hypothetical protein
MVKNHRQVVAVISEPGLSGWDARENVSANHIVNGRRAEKTCSFIVSPRNTLA